jgi:hypothetical protein
MNRLLVCGTLVALFVGGCSNNDLTVSQYAAEVAALVQEFDARLDAEAEAYFSTPPSVDSLRRYLDIRVDGYRKAVDDLDAIDPPEPVADLHATFKEIMSTILIAEETRAKSANTLDSVEEITDVWEGPESQAVRIAEERAVVLCHAAQERFDETAEGAETLSDVPWMPSELKSAVRTALGCP